MSGPPPLPVTVISGYLGAGKTTLVNRLLSQPHGRRITVLVNDFGEIALDESLIENRDGDTIALANGCMCCSIGGDLYDAVDRVLRAEPRAGHLVIETSGVADPARIAAIARAEPEMRHALTAVAVDAANFEAGLADPLLSDTLARQVRAAGLILLTKTDRAAPAEREALAGRLDALAPGVPRLEAAHGEAPAELLLDPAEAPPAPEAEAAGPDHAVHYRSWAWRGAEAVDPEGLRALLEAGTPGLVRLKGVARLAGGGWGEFHRAGRDWALRPVGAPAQGAGRAVAIGPAARFDPDALEARWRELLA